MNETTELAWVGREKVCPVNREGTHPNPELPSETAEARNIEFLADIASKYVRLIAREGRTAPFGIASMSGLSLPEATFMIASVGSMGNAPSMSH